MRNGNENYNRKFSELGRTAKSPESPESPEAPGSWVTFPRLRLLVSRLLALVSLCTLLCLFTLVGLAFLALLPLALALHLLLDQNISLDIQVLLLLVLFNTPHRRLVGLFTFGHRFKRTLVAVRAVDIRPDQVVAFGKRLLSPFFKDRLLLLGSEDPRREVRF